MGKHIFWGIVVRVVATIGAYTGLAIAGYPEQAEALGGAVAFIIGMTIFLYFIFAA